jgi:hypothetical protein
MLTIKTLTAVLAAAVATTATAATAAGCGDTGTTAAPASYRGEDCDPEDLRNYEDDCGYWDTSSGTFVLWYWVIPNVGGTRPPGWRASVPRGGSYTKPRNANTAAVPRPQKLPPGAAAPKAPAKVAPPAPRPGGNGNSGGSGGSGGSGRGGGYQAPAPKPAQPAPRLPAPPPKVGR